MSDKNQLIESTNQFQTLLIAFVLIVAIVYFFLELRKVEIKIGSLDDLVLKLSKKLTDIENYTSPQGKQNKSTLQVNNDEDNNDEGTDDEILEKQVIESLNTSIKKKMMIL